MKNPYDVLEVAETAGDAEIQKAYLRAVRQFPPERAPQRFQEVRAAFETLKTQRARLRYALFHHEPPESTPLLRPWLQQTAAGARPNPEDLLRLIVLSVSAEPKPE